MHPHYRQAEESDIPFLNETTRLSKGHWGYDTAFMDAFLKGFSIDDRYVKENPVYILTVDGEKAGYFSFLLDKEELDLFFLRPEWIGKGVGRVLWQACLAIAKKHNLQKFILWSDPNTEGFYSKMGCEKIGVRKSPFLPDRYPPVMQYIIN